MNQPTITPFVTVETRPTPKFRIATDYAADHTRLGHTLYINDIKFRKYKTDKGLRDALRRYGADVEWRPVTLFGDFFRVYLPDGRTNGVLYPDIDIADQHIADLMRLPAVRELCEKHGVPPRMVPVEFDFDGVMNETDGGGDPERDVMMWSIAKLNESVIRTRRDRDIAVTHGRSTEGLDADLWNIMGELASRAIADKALHAPTADADDPFLARALWIKTETRRVNAEYPTHPQPRPINRYLCDLSNELFELHTQGHIPFSVIKGDDTAVTA